MDENGFRYGMVVRNSLVQDFVVMVVTSTKPWQYAPGHPLVPQARAIVMSDRGHAARTAGAMVSISGRVGPDWLVVS